ncbi:diguanylate cyclase [Marinobacter sp.]|uniref:sensor domain-containing diguanylate cyclase n=1 Tax=Marinobacter sp. TaxID=50741 RepID=UPI00385173D6
MAHRTPLALTILIMLVMLLSGTLASAGNGQPGTIVLPADSLPLDVGQSLQYLADPVGKMDIGKIRETPDSYWQQVESDNASFGFTDDVYWFRTRILNTTPSAGNWILELAYPLIDNIDGWLFRDGILVEHFVTGDEKAFAQRPVKHRNFLFPVTAPGNETLAVYFRVQTSSAVQMPLWLTTQDQLFHTEQTLLTVHGMYFGIIAVMIIYNLFIFFSIRDPAYLLYVMFVLAVGSFQFSLHGFSYQFLWSQSPLLQDRLPGLFVAMSSLFGAWFTIKFLNLREYSRWLYRTLAVFAVTGGVMSLLALFLPYHQVIRPAAAMAFVCVVFVSFAGFYVWYRGYKPAAHYSVAFASLLAGTAMMILNKFGLVPLNAFTENGQQIGSLIQMVLLSLALAFRMKVMRDETEEAQLEATIRLEYRVRERTIELERANEKLQKLSAVDPLTGAFNRRYLDDQFTSEWKRAMRDRVAISLIMLDIDHFKSFNDTYGHQVGDECLQLLARLVMESVFRPSDIVVRYGGEEFAVVLPNTLTDGALTVARRVEEKLAENPFRVDGEDIYIRVSQGIATMVPKMDEFPETLIKRADQALYLAKEEGRNRYLVYGQTEELETHT